MFHHPFSVTAPGVGTVWTGNGLCPGGKEAMGKAKDSDPSSVSRASAHSDNASVKAFAPILLLQCVAAPLRFPAGDC
jgi:hypothetical protein